MIRDPVTIVVKGQDPVPWDWESDAPGGSIRQIVATAAERGCAVRAQRFPIDDELWFAIDVWDPTAGAFSGQLIEVTFVATTTTGYRFRNAYLRYGMVPSVRLTTLRDVLAELQAWVPDPDRLTRARVPVGGQVPMWHD